MLGNVGVFPKMQPFMIALALKTYFVIFSSNEIRLSDPVPNDTPLTAGRKTRAKKKIRLSEFERSVNNHLPTTVGERELCSFAIWE